jgi:hypothetical protein
LTTFPIQFCSEEYKYIQEYPGDQNIFSTRHKDRYTPTLPCATANLAVQKVSTGHTAKAERSVVLIALVPKTLVKGATLTATREIQCPQTTKMFYLLASGSVFTRVETTIVSYVVHLSRGEVCNPAL